MVTNQEFYEGKTSDDKARPYFNFNDSIAAYEKLGKMEQLTAATRRIEANGLKNSLIFNQLAYLKQQVKQLEVNKYNKAVDNYNDGVSKFNEFIQYLNNQFKPSRPDAEIQEMIDVCYDKLVTAKKSLTDTKASSEDMATRCLRLGTSIDDALAHVEDQKAWLKKYLSKGKLGRATSFTKYTWYGIPLN